LLQEGFVPYKNFYLLKEEDKIYEFLSDRVMELESKSMLFYSEDFRRLGIRAPGGFKAGVRMNSEFNMLEIDLIFSEVPADELRDMLHSYQIKKKYYRLKNGSFINLEDKTIHEVTNILNSLNITDRRLKEDMFLKEDKLLLEKHHALYLDKAFSNRNFEFERDHDFVALVDKITNPSQTEYILPEGIIATLRPYQLTGYKWLKTLSDNGLGGILADDMGLGKTLQSIVYIASAVDPGHQVHTLIVCPTSLIFNWQDEIENFAPHMKALVITGNPVERQEMIARHKDYDVLITSYPLIRRDVALYEKIDFHTVFIDEAQFIKNDSSMNAKSVKKLRASHRFALTGTPIENSLSELWSIFDFIMPDYLNSHSRFVEMYEKPILKEDQEALDDLHQHISPFILRRMKKDVLKELPDKYESKMLTELSEDQKLVYLSYLENIRGEIHSELEENGIEKSRIKILAALTRLRQICCHPSTFIENYQGGSGKLELLMELIPEAIANDHRILVFSQFTSMLRIIENELKDLEIPYFYLEGATPTQNRNDYVKRFNTGEGKVFLISLKAGGTGLNLTGADTVIHYDPWWNPAVEDQATDRAYRIGQQNKVHVVKLITRGTIEEKIFKLQRKKKELSNSVISSKEVFINTLSREELEELFNPM
jgi:SNF2 family DNA or RNA helicase